MFMKKRFILITAVCCIAIGAWLTQKNTPQNALPKLTIHDSIYLSPHRSLTLDTFSIAYCEHAPTGASNPNFPAIHISTTQPHNGWIHIVHSDAKNPKTETSPWNFVDASNDILPLYNLENDFYDAPHWSFSRMQRPLSYWKGHAYAVTIDQKTGRISYIGGIEWGFLLHRLSLMPKALRPRLLTKEDWKSDWTIMQTPVYASCKYKIAQ